MKMNVCIKGAGCDTVSIPRFEEKMNNTRVVDKLFTEYEQNYIADKQIPSAAGIWAAKEAASKSLGTGFYGFTIKDIEVRHTAHGQPQIILYNGALNLALNAFISVFLTSPNRLLRLLLLSNFLKFYRNRNFFIFIWYT